MRKETRKKEHQGPMYNQQSTHEKRNLNNRRRVRHSRVRTQTPSIESNRVVRREGRRDRAASRGRHDIMTKRVGCGGWSGVRIRVLDGIEGSIDQRAWDEARNHATVCMRGEREMRNAYACQPCA